MGVEVILRLAYDTQQKNGKQGHLTLKSLVKNYILKFISVFLHLLKIDFNLK